MKCLDARSAFLLIVLAGCSGPPARNFGPEWSKTWEGDNPVYEKKVIVPVSHYGAGDVSGYHLQMEHDDVHVMETDGDMGYRICTRHGGFEVEKDATTHTNKITFTIGDHTYFDLNGDGVIDAMFTHHKPHIFIEGRWLEVRASKCNFRYKDDIAVSVENGAQFTFAGDHREETAK